MDNEDSRAVLGLPSDATKGEAQRAFRRLAKQTHPDAGGDAVAFRAVACAWADLAAVLPSDGPCEPSFASPVPPADGSSGESRPASAGPWSALSPYARAYRPVPSRVVWAEVRPSARSTGTPRTHRRGPDFATILEAEMARQAA